MADIMDNEASVVRYYAKPGCAYSLSTDAYEEAVLIEKGFILMKSECPEGFVMASDDGSWVVDTPAAFTALRKDRNARLVATDLYLIPDYPITADGLENVKAYRAALRDLPEQEGAPWDGGGEGTPWPVLATLEV